MRSQSRHLGHPTEAIAAAAAKEEGELPLDDSWKWAAFNAADDWDRRSAPIRNMRKMLKDLVPMRVGCGITYWCLPKMVGNTIPVSMRSIAGVEQCTGEISYAAVWRKQKPDHCLNGLCRQSCFNPFTS